MAGAKDIVERYCRQMILPPFGGHLGQSKLLSAKVLIVGAGGLGCPAALYLAGAGIGTMGIVDADSVEETNLHRQIAHTEERCGLSKAKSLASSMKALNSSVQIVEHKYRLGSANVLETFRAYDIILDCTDNVASRYLISDGCAILKKPLVAGAAIGFDGQLTTYCWDSTRKGVQDETNKLQIDNVQNEDKNCDSKTLHPLDRLSDAGMERGPCMRCIFPSPPPANTVGSCDTAGVLGPVPGTIGVLQAMETIKIIAMGLPNYSGRMLFYSGLTGNFRIAMLRKRNPQCPVCSDKPTLNTPLDDYLEFCGLATVCKPTGLSLLEAYQRMTPTEFNSQKDKCVIIDVRPSHMSKIYTLPGALCIPLNDLGSHIDEIRASSRASDGDKQLVCICRRGNDSQRAVKLLESLGVNGAKDLIGGLHLYSQEIDDTVPIY